MNAIRQYDLFSGAPPSVRGSDTSQAAADSIAPKVGKLQAIVLDFIRSRGEQGATDEEIQDGAGMPASTQRPRRVELHLKSMIVDSGERRKTRSGRLAVVWRAAVR